MSQDAVWLDVLPNMSGFGPALIKGADQEASKAGRGLGSKLGTGIKAGLGVIASAGGVVAQHLYGIGKEFEDLSNSIHISSGAVGGDLDALVDSAKRIGTQVPAEFSQIGDAVANFNTYVGATGEPLERLTTQVMEASRLLGEDGVKNSESFGKAMRQWGLDANEGADLMDSMYVATQDYGVSLDKLSGHLERNSATLQNAGFTAEESVGFFAQLEAGGIQVTRVMPGLNAAFRRWSEEGKNSKEEMARVSEAMKNAETDAEALNIATEAFGAQGAQRLTTAIRGGVLELDDLTGAFSDADGAIAASADETRSFEESWQVFKNTLKVLVEPAASVLFDLISQGMQWINDNAIPWIDRMTEAWENSEGPVGQVREVFDRVWAFLKDSLVPIFKTFVDYIRQNVIPFVERLVGVVKDTMIPIFQDVWAMFRDKVIPILKDVADFIKQRVVPVIKDFAERVAMPLFKAVGDAVSKMWKVVKPILDLFWKVLKDYVGPTIEWLWDKVVEPTFRWIGDAIEGFGDKWGTVWDSIKAAAARPVNFVIDTVYNNGIRKALNFLPGVNLQRANTVSGFRHGGYTGHGHPDEPAGIVHAGEYVFTHEEVRRMGGPAGVERLKRSAMSEMELDLPGYRTGGAVRPVPQGHSGWNGGYYRSGGWHGGLDFPAPLGTAIRAMLPGLVSSVVHLTRSYGKHVRVDHGGGLETLYAHMQRTMAARGQGVGAGTQIGTVNSTGNSTGHHLHFEVRQGGRQVNPEPYLSGAVSGGDGESARIWEIPKLIQNVIRDIREGLTGEWGALLRGGVLGIINDVRDWAKDKLGVLGDLVFRGYAGGTAHAHPGLAWVGERGPELVRFRGGEQVYSAAESSAMARQTTTARLDPADIDRLAHAIVGVAQGISSRTVDSAFLALGRGV